MVTLSDIACSQLIETRTDTDPLKEGFSAPFMRGYAGDA